MDYTDLDIESLPDKTVVRRDFKLLCSIRSGWRALFYGKRIVLVHPNNAPSMAWLDGINEGDVLPRDSDEFL